MKKLLSWLFVLAMVFSLFASAEESIIQNIADILAQNAASESAPETGADTYAGAAEEQPEDPEDLPSAQGSPDAQLTLMVYMCGTNLESGNPQIERSGGGASLDIVEMANSEFDPESVNVLLMTGGTRDWKLPQILDEATSVYLLKDGYLLPVIEDGAARNMGDPDTLADFIDLGYTDYAADRYALILWDHGGGSISGICTDELFDGDGLSMVELVSALERGIGGRQKLEWLGFDACLMASAEIANMMAPFANYMIASEESEPGLGWNYEFLRGLEADASGAETGRRVIDLYFRAFEEYDVGTLTMSCIDLSWMDQIVESATEVFDVIEKNLTEDTYAQAARARRETRAFGRDEENGIYDFDLIDMRDFIEKNDPQGADLEKLNDALDSGIVYVNSNVSGCSGLSLYHPFYNKQMYPRFMQIYSGLGFSEEYEAYANKFGQYLVRGTTNTWPSLQAAISDILKDVRSVFSIQLSDEQFAELLDVRLLALQRGEAEGTYRLIATQNAHVDEEGRINGEYVHTNLFVTDGEGNALWDIPLLYTNGDDGAYLVQVQLAKEGQEPVDARLICSRDEETNRMTIDMVWLYDELAQVYSPRMMAQLDAYDTIIFSQADRAAATDGIGALLPFSAWEIAAVHTYSCLTGGSWQLAFVRDHLDVEGLSVAFEIQDIFNDAHMSDMVPVNAASEGNTGITVVYDDADLLYLSADSVSLSKPSNGSGIRFSAQVTNISDGEAIVSIENVRVNGASTSDAAQVYGMGEFDGLRPRETQIVMLSVDTSGIAEAGALERIEFDMVLLDAEGNALGVVPVTIHANYPL